MRVVDSRDGETVRWVAVARHDDVHLSGIEPGTYYMLVTLGLDWDDSEMRFRQMAVYERIDDTFKFEERITEDGVIYDRHTVTLNPVSNGNLPYHHISEAEFRRGLRRRPLER